MSEDAVFIVEMVGLVIALFGAVIMIVAYLHPRTPRPRVDKVRMGNGSGDGLVYEAFDPPWWKLHRWFSWFFLRRHAARGTMTMTINDKKFTVRIRSMPIFNRPVIHANVQARINGAAQFPESLKLPTDR